MKEIKYYVDVYYDGEGIVEVECENEADAEEIFEKIQIFCGAFKTIEAFHYKDNNYLKTEVIKYEKK